MCMINGDGSLSISSTQSINCDIDNNASGINDLNNTFIKHLLLLFMIYFTIDFAKDENAPPEHPIKNMGKAFIVWVIFHVFTHLKQTPTAILVILLMIVYISDNYSSYLKSLPDVDSNLIEKLKLLEKFLNSNSCQFDLLLKQLTTDTNIVVFHLKYHFLLAGQTLLKLNLLR